MPPGTPRSRSLTRLTMRVGLPHLGQSVLLVVSVTFLRTAVFAILAPTAMRFSPDVSTFAQRVPQRCREVCEWNWFLNLDPDVLIKPQSGDSRGKTLRLNFLPY